MSLSFSLLDDWKIAVTVLRSGGRDSAGNLRPDAEHVVEGCLVSPSATDDPVDLGDVVTGTATLIRHSHDFAFESTDRVRVPDGVLAPAGVWRVAGKPKTWPLGVEVPLEWEGPNA